MVDARGRVTEHQLWVDRHLRAQAGALRASPKRCVEREGSWFNLGQRQRVLVGARHLFAKDSASRIRVVIDQVDDDSTAGQLERGFNRVGQSPDDVGFGNQSVDNHRDVVLERLFERSGFSQRDDLPIDHRAGITLSA